MIIQLPESVKMLFVTAGWQPGRKVFDCPSGLVEHPASEILDAFGGLTVRPTQNAGEECGTSDLEFGLLVEIYPALLQWEILLGTSLVGVAEMHGGHGGLYIAADGRCFGLSFVHDAFFYEGSTFSEAVERLLLGRRSRPMLRPDQSFVHLYGICYKQDDPDVYHYIVQNMSSADPTMMNAI